MRIFGFSIWTILILLGIFTLGAKNPGWLTKIPVLNKI